MTTTTTPTPTPTPTPSLVKTSLKSSDQVFNFVTNCRSSPQREEREEENLGNQFVVDKSGNAFGFHVHRAFKP